MPTYDYECDACGHEFELFQSITEPVKRVTMVYERLAQVDGELGAGIPQEQLPELRAAMREMARNEVEALTRALQAAGRTADVEAVTAEQRRLDPR